MLEDSEQCFVTFTGLKLTVMEMRASVFENTAIISFDSINSHGLHLHERLLDFLLPSTSHIGTFAYDCYFCMVHRSCLIFEFPCGDIV